MIGFTVYKIQMCLHFMHVCVFVYVLFCGASALPELQATFAGGCLLITAINLPADSGLKRHVAAVLREVGVGEGVAK